MKTGIWRAVVVLFSVAIVAFLALQPRYSYGDAAYDQGYALGLADGQKKAAQAGQSEVTSQAPPPVASSSGGGSSGC